MNEAETRAEHIDPALKAAGWGVVEGSYVKREHITLGRLQGGGKRGKQEIADYVLVYKNHKLAVIEAKAWDKSYTEGVAQAKTYAKKLGSRFAYATNGQRIYGIDMQRVKKQTLPATLPLMRFGNKHLLSKTHGAMRLQKFRLKIKVALGVHDTINTVQLRQC